MAKRFSEEASIKDVLKSFVVQNKLETGIDKVKVKEIWFAVMGNGVANYTEAIELKNTTLYVKLTSSVLREELSYGREKIIKMINDEMGKDIINKVILT
ncbi:DUF721 domain-containing protein [Flavobacterium sp. TP390]|uniref:DUF721 domain-containing protein n=1 Tax=Flavobacterium profundi TaxID=1774945 RepID=A0A6I4IVJ0_9FLAO|nr:DUF721 domain-containing protein [Flavobacterium profundi]MVO10937.1 DUF721 domain-containing protein [Flavobacterium profundi]